MSSNLVQKSHNDRKPNKNHRMFKKKSEQGTTKSVGNLKTESKNVSIEVSKGKYSGKTNQSGVKSELSDIINENKKINEGDSGLCSLENLQKNEKDLSKRKDELSQPISIDDFSASTKKNAGVEKENHGESNKLNKGNSSKISAVPYRNPYKKKSTDPLLINFQDILLTQKTKRKAREHNIKKARAQRLKSRELLSGNILDSSNPKRSRGKHREIKKKKLSNFKLTIIKERIIKQKVKEMSADENIKWISLVDKIDFNTEVKAYLDKLKNLKLKNSYKCKKSLTENLDDKEDPKRKQNVETTVKKTSLELSENKLEENKIKEKKIPEVQGKEGIKFSAKFREYCDNFVTTELNSAVAELIKGLISLQDKLYLRDPIKAKVKKRHVSGIREVRKYLTLKRVKMIIIAPNLEKLQMEGSIYDSINELKLMADSQKVPYGFALDRYKMGRYTKKNVPVSAFAVLSYEGIETLFENALHHLMEAKWKFSELAKANSTKNNKEQDENSKVIASLISSLREGLQVKSEPEGEEEEEEDNKL